MDKKLQAISNDIDTPAEDTRALIAATADAGGEKVRKARHRLSATLENGKEIYGRVRDKAVEGVKATNDAVYEHPYQGIGIALGAGVIIGCLIARRWFPYGD